jgi:hypothetical protein
MIHAPFIGMYYQPSFLVFRSFAVGDGKIFIGNFILKKKKSLRNIKKPAAVFFFFDDNSQAKTEPVRISFTIKIHR